jgi:hypothetical protein
VLLYIKQPTVAYIHYPNLPNDMIWYDMIWHDTCQNLHICQTHFLRTMTLAYCMSNEQVWQVLWEWPLLYLVKLYIDSFWLLTFHDYRVVSASIPLQFSDKILSTANTEMHDYLSCRVTYIFAICFLTNRTLWTKFSLVFVS